MQQITYCPDTTALITELTLSAPEMLHTQEDGSTVIHPLTKIPTYRHGGETISVVKDLPAQLQGLDNLQTLGEITGAPFDSEITFKDSSSRVIYERVTEVLTPIIDVDLNGDSTETIRPYIIGVVG